jgi:hypothetical protein
MIDLLRDPSLLPPWRDASEGKPVDWVAALDGWGSTIDWPGCSFWEQHVEAFPDAKVLLNVRDKEAWYKSCLSTIYPVKELMARGELKGNTERAPSPEVMAMINRVIWDGTFDNRFLDKEHAFSVFDAHVEDVKAKVPADKLLVYEVKQGWEPLCDFLEVPVPAQEFPRLNDSASFRAMFGITEPAAV